MRSARNNIDHSEVGASAIRSLRRKFIIMTMIALVITLAALDAAIYAIFSQSNINRSDSIIESLYEHDGEFPAADAVRRPSLDPTFTVNPETQYETRYAWAHVDADGRIAELNSEHIAVMSDAELGDMIYQALTAKSLHGYIDYYRYGVFHNDDGTETVILLDCYLRLQTRVVVTQMCIAVSLSCAIIVFFLLIPLSKRIARPFARNLQRQQRFVTDASHELKTPLAIISANNDLTERLSGETQWTRSTKAQIARLNTLIRDLIDMARSSESFDPSSFPVFDLSRLAERTAEDFRPLAEAKGKRIETDIQSDIGMRGSEEALERLLSILLDNAVKHGDDGCRIDVALRMHRKSAVLRVSNPAATLGEDEVALLFDRFYRTNGARARSTRGYGIGLSVAQGIAERHEGRLSASKEGDLLVFTATLPRCAIMSPHTQ